MLVADRLTVAQALDEPLIASVDLKKWGYTVTHTAKLAPPPDSKRAIVDQYQTLFAELKAFSFGKREGANDISTRLDSPEKWQILLRLEREGTLRLGLARSEDIGARIAVARSWWDKRWEAQQVFHYMD